MMKKIAALLATAGTLLATVGSQACMFLIVDEPTCPKSLIK
ncbi:MAG: cyclic lactone autoinducer peptide [Firmicutes bacterium]|nr:cyclic lactone autoinducer peptide [Bacillota bacterium]